MLSTGSNETTRRRGPGCRFVPGGQKAAGDDLVGIHDGRKRPPRPELEIRMVKVGMFSRVRLGGIEAVLSGLVERGTESAQVILRGASSPAEAGYLRVQKVGPFFRSPRRHPCL